MKKILFIMLALVLAIGMLPVFVASADVGPEVLGNYAFVPNAGEASVSKVDLMADPPVEVARYSTVQPRSGAAYTFDKYRVSRLAMDSMGNAWALNSMTGQSYDIANAQGQVVRISANPVTGETPGVDTSNSGGLAGMLDTDVRVAVFDVGDPGDCPRTISIVEEGGNMYLWIGFYMTEYFEKFVYDDNDTPDDPSDDTLESTGESIDVAPYNAYTAIIDGNGILWGVSRNASPYPSPSGTPGVFYFDTNNLGDGVTALPYDLPGKSGENPYAIMLKSDGTVWVSDGSNWGTNQARYFAVYTWGTPVTVQYVNTGVNSQAMRGFMEDGEGNIWATTINGLVIKLEPDNGGWLGTQMLSGLGELTGIGADAAGYFWVIQYGSDQMSRFDPLVAPPLSIGNSITLGIGPYAYGNFVQIAPPAYSICGYKYDDSGEGLEDWTIILEKWNGVTWEEVAETTTDENGKYCFTELPEGEYRVSEELQDGWSQLSPAGGYYDVTLPGDSAFYGIGRTSSKDVYELDPLTGTGTFIVSLSGPVSNPNISGPNGLAYDPANDLLYFTTYPGDATLYSYDIYASTFTTLGLLSDYLSSEELIQIACADFYNGKYYFINGGAGNFTDDLYEVTFNADGTIDAVIKLADISGGAAHWGFWGDIAIKDGVIYGYGMNQGPGDYEFFKVNCDGSGFVYIKDPAYSFSLQLAFGADGLLYGYDLAGNDYYTIDLVDGSLTPKAQDCTIVGFNDMASGRMYYNFVNEMSVETLEVTKTAETSYTRTHDWLIDKSVDTDNGYLEEDLPKIWLYVDGSGDESAQWTVDVTYDGYTDSAWNVSGEITIENTGEIDAVITGADDELAGSEITVNWGVTFPYTLTAGSTLTGTYDEDVASEIAGYNEVTVYTEANPDTGYFADAEIVWGDPTTVVNETVTIEDESDLFGTVTLGTVTAPNGGTFTYGRDFYWGDYNNTGPSADYVYENIATIVETGQHADATLLVNVQGYYYETAYAKGDQPDAAAAVVDFCPEYFSNWGWTNQIDPGSYTWYLWAGAGQCDTTKGILVGTATVTYGTDGSFDVDINLYDDNILDEQHVYAGGSMFPQVKKGKDTWVSTVAPGQYYIEELDGSTIWVIVHSVVGIPDPDFGP